MRLRGQYVPVSPALWDGDMDVSVNVALGSMNVEKKIAVLMQVVQDQTGILTEYGPDNPVVSLSMLRDAKAKILALNGVKDVENYYKPVPPDWQPPPPPPPEPSPDELWIQAEKEMAFQKSMKELAIKQDELALKGRELELKESQAVVDRDLALRALELKERDSIRDDTTGPFNADIERYKADSTAANVQRQIESSERLALEKLALETRKVELDFEMRRYEADLSAQSATETAKTTAASSEKAAAKAPQLVGLQPPTDMGPMMETMGKMVESVKVLASQKPDFSRMPAPVVHVPAPIVNIAAPEREAPRKKGKRKGKITGPDGKVYNIETSD